MLLPTLFKVFGVSCFDEMPRHRLRKTVTHDFIAGQNKKIFIRDDHPGHFMASAVMHIKTARIFLPVGPVHIDNGCLLPHLPGFEFSHKIGFIEQQPVMYYRPLIDLQRGRIHFMPSVG